MGTRTRTKKEEITNGISTSVALLFGSLYLYLNPEFFGLSLISYTIGMLCGVIGIAGFLIELSKLNEDMNDFFKDLGATFILIVLIVILNIIFSNVFVNIIIFLLILACTYAFSNNVIKVYFIIQNNGTSMKKFLSKAPMVILNLFIFILTIMQILQIIKILE